MATAKKKLRIQDLYKMKAEKQMVSWVTSYSAPQGRFVEEAGIEMILVGDR